MEIKKVYPTPDSISHFLRVMRKILKPLFLLAAVSSIIVNLCVGGVPWCLVVCWSVYIANSLINTPLIDYNLISEGVLLTERLVILLLIIELMLAGGWAHIVIPIVVSAALTALSVIFMSSTRKRKPNIMPLIVLLTISTLISGGMLLFRFGCLPANIVLCGVSGGLLLITSIICGKSLPVEIKKYFHTR